MFGRICDGRFVEVKEYLRCKCREDGRAKSQSVLTYGASLEIDEDCYVRHRPHLHGCSSRSSKILIILEKYCRHITARGSCTSLHHYPEIDKELYPLKPLDTGGESAFASSFKSGRIWG